MLTIRKEQVDIFEKEARNRFIFGLIPHVCKHFPWQCEDIDDSLLFQALEQFCSRAADYGFTSERDLCLFADLSIILGSGFDTDPQLPWAAAILNDDAVKYSRMRMDKLWEIAMEYTDNVIGTDEVFPVKPCKIAFQSLTTYGFRNESRDLEHRLIGMMKDIWPEKVNNVGVSQLSVLINNSLAYTRRFGLLRSGGQADFVIVAFLLGHHFYKDPIYPWIQDILIDSQRQPGDQQAVDEMMARFRSAFMKWLDRRRQE